MMNHMLINFYLRPSTTDEMLGAVYVQITIDQKRATLGAVTSISKLGLPKSVMILSANWDNKRKRVKESDPKAAMVNKAIAECERLLNKIYAKHDSYDIPMTTKGVRAEFLNGAKMRPSLPDLMERFLAERKALGTKASTIETYGFKFVPFKEFLHSEGIEERAAEDFTPGMLAKYKTYLIVTRKNSERSADKARQVIKTLFLWAAENELIQKNPLINVRIHVDKTPNLECLNQDEVQLIREATLTPILRRVADCFEFACYTGLAYQDMQSLTAASVKAVEGRQCIVGKRLKTGTEFYIPISERVSVLIDKYKGVTMPLPSLYDYNALLKQLMLVVGIEKTISSHTARKTFADWCINELSMSEEATIVAMGQKAAKELTPYRKTRPKRLFSEFPESLLRPTEIVNESHISRNPFTQIYKAS